MLSFRPCDTKCRFLSSNSLTGIIPSSIGNLIHMTTLYELPWLFHSGRFFICYLGLSARITWRELFHIRLGTFNQSSYCLENYSKFICIPDFNSPIPCRGVSKNLLTGISTTIGNLTKLFDLYATLLSWKWNGRERIGTHFISQFLKKFGLEPIEWDNTFGNGISHKFGFFVQESWFYTKCLKSILGTWTQIDSADRFRLHLKNSLRYRLCMRASLVSDIIRTDWNIIISFVIFY